MSNISKQRRERMISNLEHLKQLHNDDKTLTAINEIENALREKKYGLLFEEHTEHVDDMLENNIPVLVEKKDKRVCKSEESSWNFLIEGDNLQALYLLQKTHKGKVDCIYIDPPYNTGAHDWKYNNNYVGDVDTFRHSKWLSMMKRRLEIAHTLLKRNGVLICAIDHYELLQLGMLMDDIFGEDNRIGIVSVVHKPEGRNQEKFFATSNEFALFYARDISKCKFNSVILSEEKMSEFTYCDSKGRYKLDQLIAKNHGRAGEDKNLRVNRPHKFYPIYVSQDGMDITLEEKEGYFRALPISKEERTWKYDIPTMAEKIKEGEIVAIVKKGSVSLFDKYRTEKGELIKTHWIKKEYNANMFGTKILTQIIGKGAFDFPKSLYLIKDIIAVCAPKDGLVLDFFAGSGTTMHAVNLLNKEDGGQRRCIMVTNNEISEAEEKMFLEKGIKKGDSEWEAKGIANNVTWPRTLYSINGTDRNGIPLDGFYAGSDIKMSDGFITNVKYLKCDWVERRPEDRMLSSILMNHIKEMIELENSIEIDNRKNVLILSKADFRNYLLNNNEIENVWINQNIIFNAEEYAELIKHQFKYIPQAYFGEELREAAE